MATAAATGGSREARRRRIVDRGTDRLALITGRIQSLPADPRETAPADVAQDEHAASNPDQDSAQIQTKELLSQVQSQISEEQSQIRLPSHSHRKLFDTRQISSAISGSENARMCTSVAAAILVVMGCCNIRTIVISKPFYLLVLTNISIVVACIVMGTRSSKVRVRGPKLGGSGLVDHIGTTLESGLMLQKIFGAVFMDFSIYVIALVCSLSLARVLGW